MTVALALAVAAFGLWRLWRWLGERGVPVDRRLAFGQVAAAGALVAAGLVAPGAAKGPLFALGLMLAGVGLRALQRTAPVAGSGRPTTVRSVWLEMTLDPATGTIDGVVLRGAHAGTRLSRLGRDDLLGLAAEIDDPRSLTLLRSYLDAAHPGWDAAPAPRPPGPMSRDEALAVLGLTAGADAAAIRAAHRRLMKKVHPDAGGSAELAERVNRARDALLG